MKKIIAAAVSASMLMLSFTVFAGENRIGVSDATKTNGNVEITATLATDSEISGKLIAAVYDMTAD